MITRLIMWCRLVLSLLLLGTSVACAEKPPAYHLEEVASGLGVPWGMVLLDDTRILFTERRGRVGVYKLATGETRYLPGVPAVLAEGQGGLLDVAASPVIATDANPNNRWIYFTYSKPVNGQGRTTLARARFTGDRLMDWQDMLVTHSGTNTSRHYGSRIAFDGAGHLYFSVGDRGERPNGQDLTTHAGSILRVQLDGTVPADNPFVGRTDALPEIWSYGHRNPQGLFWDHETGQLWAIEHGPRGGDEINKIQKGGNYGWPVVSHGKEYWGPISVGEATHKPGMIDPVKVYIPSIAPGSLLRYSGKAFPRWAGCLMSGALALTHLNIITLDASQVPTSEERILSDLGERVRALAESPEGWIYFSTDSGRIYRLRP